MNSQDMKILMEQSILESLDTVRVPVSAILIITVDGKELEIFIEVVNIYS
jgi:hypothetical protein